MTDTQYSSSSSGSCQCMQAVAIVVLGLLIALTGWRFSSYLAIQNENLENSIKASEQTLNAAAPLVQQARAVNQRIGQTLQHQPFMQLLVSYLQATGDQNVLALFRNYGIQIRPAPPQGQQPAAGTQAPAPAAPAKPAPAKK